MTGLVCTDPDMKYTMHRVHKICDSEVNARCQLQHLNNENAMMESSGGGGQWLVVAVTAVSNRLLQMFKGGYCCKGEVTYAPVWLTV